MPDEENRGAETNGHENCSEPYVNQTFKDDSSSLNGGQKGGADGQLQMRHVLDSAPPTISIMISRPEESSGSNAVILKNVASDRDEKIGKVATGSANKDFLPRSESYQEQCRICQQQTDEPLIDLGCRCRGELANAHQSCIGIWFCTRGSNKCEICLHAAVNVPFPETQPNANYWVWRVDPANGGHPERERVWILTTVEVALALCGLPFVS